jgi:UrcA family protein
MTTINLRNAASACAAIFLSSVAVGMVAVPQAVEARSPSTKPVVVTAPERDSDTIKQRVYFGDLNLASLPGEKLLNRRVGGAVREICLEITGRNANFHDSMNCRGNAWGSARPQVQKAIRRARELAMYGKSSIAAATIVISLN